MRVGNVIEVAGTTAPGDTAYEQAKSALAKIEAALVELGGSLADVVRTRMFVAAIEENAAEVGQAHGETFGTIKPATAMYGVTGFLTEGMLVEIEATALLS